MGELAEQLRVGTAVDLIVEPRGDVWQGRGRVDLVVVDVARCDEEAFRK